MEFGSVNVVDISVYKVEKFCWRDRFEYNKINL